MNSSPDLVMCSPPRAEDGSCVLVVLKSAKSFGDELARAQQNAIEAGLPLAAVYCHNPQTVLYSDQLRSELEEAEAYLAKLNIPFILVIGNPEVKVNGVLRHFKPANTFWDKGGEAYGKLVKHPAAWPGRIIPVAQLDQFLQKPETLTC